MSACIEKALKALCALAVLGILGDIASPEEKKGEMRMVVGLLTLRALLQPVLDLLHLLS